MVDLEANDALISTEPFAVQAKDHRTAGQGTGPMIYVTRKGSAYDSIVPGDLPNEGLFQLLEVGGPTGLMTEFGPGDKGHIGSRW